MKASDIIGKFRFTRTSDSGGSGGGVSDEVKGFFIDRKIKLNDTMAINSNPVNLYIDDTNIITAKRNMGKVEGLQIIIASLNNTSMSFTNGASISLELESSYTPPNYKTLRIAEDKSFVIFCDTSTNKFFYIPLNKSENTYTFGTPIVLNTESSLSLLHIINSTTFAAYNGSEILIIELLNNELSIVKTLNEGNSTIQMGSIGNILMIAAASKAIAYDIITGDKLYEDSSYKPCWAVVILGNKAIFIKDSGNFAYCLEVKNNMVEKVTLSFDDKGDFSMFDMGLTERIVKQIDDSNYVVICTPNLDNISSGQGYPFYAFAFDSANNKISSILISHNYYRTTSSPVITELCGYIILGWIYQSSSRWSAYSLYNNKIVSLKYKNDTYVIDKVGE